MSPAPAEARRVLLIHPGALGDLVQAGPAFASVRRSFAHAELSLLVGAPFEDFAGSMRLFDRVLGFDARAAYHGDPLARLAVGARVASQLRRLAPDRVAVFKGAPAYALLARASGAPVRVGLTRGPLAALLTGHVPLEPGRHWEDHYLAVAAALGGDPALTGEVRWTASAMGESVRRECGPGLLVGIAPGGARNVKTELASKRWPATRHAELARRIVARWPGARIVLLGAPADRTEADVVRAVLPDSAVLDLVGRTSIPDARAVIGVLDAFVVHDSALLHVAGTVRTPTLALFGPTDPRTLCPRGAHVRPLWQPARARPCHDDLTGRVTACDATCCIERLGVEQVFHALEEALALPSRRTG